MRILDTPAAQPLLHPNQLQTDAATVMADRHDQLSLATGLARQSPFSEANPATNEDTVAHAFGYAAQSALYDELAGRPIFEALGRRS